MIGASHLHSLALVILISQYGQVLSLLVVALTSPTVLFCPSSQAKQVKKKSLKTGHDRALNESRSSPSKPESKSASEPINFVSEVTDSWSHYSTDVSLSSSRLYQAVDHLEEFNWPRPHWHSGGGEEIFFSSPTPPLHRTYMDLRMCLIFLKLHFSPASLQRHSHAISLPRAPH